MNKPMKIIVVALTAVSLTAAFTVACGRHHGKMNPEKINKFVTWKVNDALDDLEATDAQRTEILAMKDRVIEDVKKLRADLREGRGVAVEELTSDQPDAERLHALVDSQMDKVRAFAHQELDNLLNVHATLTPKQRAQIAAEMKEHAKDHGCWK